MVVAAVICWCVAVATAATAAWLLVRSDADEFRGQVLRGVAPTQLAAATMLGAGGAVAVSAPAGVGVLALIVCVVGAVGTVAAGCWQAAKVVAQREAATADCGRSCSTCTQSCGATS